MKMGLGKKNWVDSVYPVFYFNGGAKVYIEMNIFQMSI